MLSDSEQVIPGVTATAMRPVYPLLVRNPVSSLLRVTINIGKIDPSVGFVRNDVRLTSIAFTVDAGNLGDLESL